MELRFVCAEAQGREAYVYAVSAEPLVWRQTYTVTPELAAALLATGDWERVETPAEPAKKRSTTK